jgi:hypothetical protein
MSTLSTSPRRSSSEYTAFFCQKQAAVICLEFDSCGVIQAFNSRQCGVTPPMPSEHRSDHPDAQITSQYEQLES